MVTLRVDKSRITCYYSRQIEDTSRRGTPPRVWAFLRYSLYRKSSDEKGEGAWFKLTERKNPVMKMFW